MNFYAFSAAILNRPKSRKKTAVCTIDPSGEIARHSTFEISGKKMTTSTNYYFSICAHESAVCV